MQLREIHIVSFGVLANARVRGLVPGLNVLHGPNEFGKTSLLEFARRVLFGFPTKRENVNQYLLPHSDKNSGQLVCELGDGRTLTVSRSTGTHGGPLTVTTPEGASLSEAGFRAALGHVSQDLYQKVFSVGLKELYDVDVVNLDEVKDRIYGAGLGGVSIPELKSHFEKRANDLFTKGGYKQRMKELAAEITLRGKNIREERGRLAQYDEKQNEHDLLKEKAEELGARVRTMQAQQRSFESQERLYPTFLDMQRAEKQLAEMGEVPPVPDEALAELQDRRTTLKTLAEKLEDKQERLRLTGAAIERISYDPALMRHENDIRTLMQSVASYRSTGKELPAARRDMQDAQEQVEQKLSALGEGWTTEKVRSFTLTTAQLDSLRQQEARLREREQSLDNSRRKLEVHRDNVRAAGSRQGVPKSLRLAGLAVLALGGVGCVLSVLNGDTVMAAIAGAVGLLGLLVALAPGASSARRRNPATEQLEVETQTAEGALGMARAEWSTLLRHLGLPSTLSPEAKDETLRGIEDTARELERVDEHAARIAHLEETASSIDGLYAEVAKEVREPLQGTDVAANIESLETRLAAARAEKVKQESLEEQVQQLAEEVKGLQGQHERENTELSGFMASHGVSSPEALREKYQRFAAARDLRKSIDASLRTIEATVGAGDARTVFIEELAATTPEDIGAALAGLKDRVSILETESGETNRRVGALDNELQALVSGEDLVSREAEVETLTQQLQDAYREWLTARIALWGIGAAVSRYEEERQPDVIRAAQTAFIGMTNGRYEKLLKPLDSDELRVRAVNGNDRTVHELSRGTREQLYLAMRLGLIEQYEQNAEPMPVIMDDILVNFDDDRGPLAVKALAEFAKDRQVIVMTCHASTLELYRQAGATEVELERNAALL